MMKKANYLLAGLLLLCMINCTGSTAQDDNQVYIAVTTAHWSQDLENFSMDEWKAVEKEYFDKVTSKNEYIMSTDVATHLFTADNSEIKFATAYKTWGDIPKAAKRNQELAKEAWPDSLARRAFFKKQAAYYSDFHSDEIYVPMDGRKISETESIEPQVLYVRSSKFAYPDDGSMKEFSSMMKELNDVTIQKNEFIISYSPVAHAYGADRRDFVEVFRVASMSDIEKSMEREDELRKERWPDEDERKAFFKKLGKYFTGFHADYMYQTVPELSK
ncbi:MAG: hypothetical protein JXQ96_22875 [Cyclobacteriaceae bacterium]